MYTTLPNERLVHEIELLIADINEHQQEMKISLDEIVKIMDELNGRKNQ